MKIVPYEKTWKVIKRMKKNENRTKKGTEEFIA